MEIHITIILAKVNNKSVISFLNNENRYGSKIDTKRKKLSYCCVVQFGIEIVFKIIKFFYIHFFAFFLVN